MSVIEENWDFRFEIQKIEKESYNDIQLKLNEVHNRIVKLLEGFKIKRDKFINGDTTQHQDHELRSLTEMNKQLRHSIDVKLEEIARQQNQYETYKQDQKLLSQEIKETHEAFLMAKKYYKKFLRMYYTVESRDNENQIIYIQFFTEAKKDSDNYSVRLARDSKTGHYGLLNTTPKLPILKELQRKLQETNDVPGALSCIRQAFILVRENRRQ